MNTKIIKTGLLNGLLVVVALINLLVGQAQAASEVTFYHHDALGSTIASSDETANIHWNEEYQPYGEKIYGVGKDSITGNQDWYTGKNYDEDLDLTYFGARWYDAKQGRFLSIDPVGVKPGVIHTFNRYHYANNNPFKYVDPDGRAGKSIPPILTPAQIQSQVSSAARGLPSNGYRPKDIQKQIETNNFKNAPVTKRLTDPGKIRFSQDSIKGTFRDGRSVGDMAKGLKDGSIKPGDVPAIRTVERNGQLISIDNRRLAAFKEAGVPMRTRPATASEISQAQKQGKFSGGCFRQRHHSD